MRAPPLYLVAPPVFRCESLMFQSCSILVVMDQWSRRLIGSGIHKGDMARCWRITVVSVAWHCGQRIVLNGYCARDGVEFSYAPTSR